MKYLYYTPNRKSSHRSDNRQNSEAPAGNPYQGSPNTFYDRKPGHTYHSGFDHQTLTANIASTEVSVFQQYGT